MASGSLMALVFPVDVFKTYVQTAGHPISNSTLSVCRGFNFSEMHSMTLRLYRGFMPAVLEHSASRAMLFGVGTLIKDCATPRHWSEPVRDAVSGFGAAAVKVVLLHPLDTVKTRWQLGQEKRETIQGLYNGLGPAVLRSAGGMAMWLSLRNYLEQNLPNALDGHPRHFLCGAMASTVTDLSTFPFDTLKKNLQATASSSSVHAEMYGTATRLLQNGFLRFYHGYSLRLLIVGLRGALENVAFCAWKEVL
eukprot:TRINITY_DN7589_c0_g1_i7.p1 TRINITY_DN7589_c0_g1~~TRINITY_DN7589_c0_g1_i7.p1  ORF type:complete len:284 (+),score=36.24 TRINITY_DN7589_c0_g1_i7:104-853(+)